MYVEFVLINEEGLLFEVWREDVVWIFFEGDRFFFGGSI